MDYYKLDENDCPRLTDMEGYYRWLETIPGDIRTGLGFQLARTEVGSTLVSTVYLGLDHSHKLESQPVLWETMVFSENEQDDQQCERATNRKEALEVHRRFCEKYIAKQLD